jgi:hypothetical protein
MLWEGFQIVSLSESQQIIIFHFLKCEHYSTETLSGPFQIISSFQGHLGEGKVQSLLDGAQWLASHAHCFIPKNPLDKRVGGAQSRFEHCDKEKNSVPL